MNFITLMAKSDDYVVVKLDIDNNFIENSLIMQIIENRTISELIDEIFWENHVIGHPVAHFGAWVAPLPLKPPLSTDINSHQNLSSSYNIFMELRHRGIRAHSWV